MIKIEISPGELIDKWTILIIKERKFREIHGNHDKWQNVVTEMNVLESKVNILTRHIQVPELLKSLLDVNLKLWGIEDEIRIHERDKRFDQRFIDLARLVYMTNDKRSSFKREINTLFGSELVEVKSYEAY